MSCTGPSYRMPATLTIRLNDADRARVKKRAKRDNISESDVIRGLIASMDAHEPVWPKIKHLAGSVSIDESKLTGWARQIKERNWRK